MLDQKQPFLLNKCPYSGARARRPQEISVVRIGFQKNINFDWLKTRTNNYIIIKNLLK